MIIDKDAPPPDYEPSDSTTSRDYDSKTDREPLPPQYGCITLNMGDLLRCISLPPHMIALVRDVINANWERGVQGEKDYHGAHEFKLRGHPWYGQSSQIVPAHEVIIALLAAFYHAGWELIASADITKKPDAKDTLFFRKLPSNVLPPPCTFLALSFNEGDKIRLIRAPPPVISAVQRILAAQKPGIQREEWKVPDIAYQFKLNGHPLYANGADTVKMRVLVLSLLQVLAAEGWELHATVDMTIVPGGSESGLDTDTWFFKKLQ